MRSISVSACIVAFSAQFILPSIAATPLTSQIQALEGQRRHLNEFVPYSLPPFALTFETVLYNPDASSSSSVISANDATNDGSTDSPTLEDYDLRSPLQLILSEFLFESFRILIARSKDPIPNILRFPVTLHLDATIVHRQIKSSSQANDNGNIKNRKSNPTVEVYAQFKQIIYFLSPSGNQDIPDAKYVYDLFGDFIKTAFSVDIDVLKNSLSNSENVFLQHQQALYIETDVPTDTLPFGNSNNSAANHRSQKEKLLLSFLVLLGTATAVVALLIARQAVLSSNLNKALKPSDGAFPRPPEPQAPLPGRGDEYDDGRGVSAIGPNGVWTRQYSSRDLGINRLGGNINGHLDADEEYNFVEGNVGNTRSYPGWFPKIHRKDKNNGSQRSLASQDKSQRKMNLEAQIEVPPPPTSNLTPSSSWWQKLTASRQTKTLECDKDPNDYKFPFADFPRKDGTPCLIYQESSNGEVSLSRSYNVANNGIKSPLSESSRVAACNTLLSDEEFRREFAVQSQATSQGSSSSVIEEEIEIIDKTSTSPVAAQFTQKLGKLVAMKHRHYEQERLVQNQRRREAEARDLQLRRHTIELDLDEIEASITPRSLARKRLNGGSTSNIDTKIVTLKDEIKAHRLVSSDSDFYAEEAVPPPRIRHLKKSSGPSNRTDDNDNIPPPPSPPSALSSSSTAPSRGLDRYKHWRSHRRSHSHGLNAFEEKKVDSQRDADDLVGWQSGMSSLRHDQQQQQQSQQSSPSKHQRNNSSNSDVVTFGIAAYTNIV